MAPVNYQANSPTIIPCTAPLNRVRRPGSRFEQKDPHLKQRGPILAFCAALFGRPQAIFLMVT
ncbi:hypothetical protein [Planotetraspora phitsanulokensis]|uniref:hypothetical protein n=1 Tax=Planotetraspora phitsanulokensis TaxID=575192 RepID=UPI00195229AD|nr:hypothetical protein [Planotetraspora phitsanulokensis]